jgi:hypothetical protein
MTSKSPNPQGKGLVPILESLMQTRKNLAVPAKDILQIANELFTSLFVLNSRIKFKPVIGRTYWLYRKDRIYALSLIAPEEWSPSKYGQFIGACKLQPDLTWTLELSDQCRGDRELMEEIARQRERFDQKLKAAGHIDDLLPVYVATLPFHSRVLASALAHSLRQSMQKGGISGLDFSQARKKMLPAETRPLR